MIKIIVNTDSSVTLGEDEIQRIEASVQHILSRFEDRLIKVVVQLKDENGGKPGPGDICCMMEARPRGFDSVQASDHADSLSQAVIHVGHKVERMLDERFSAASKSNR